jgi:hypothetical protein
MKNGNLVIAFSGGCFSGKTTSINYISEKFKNSVFIDEIIRKKNIISIDTVRKNPIEYLYLQDDIIRKKINQEYEFISKNKDKIILIDRALSDSLFYLTFYLDKSNFKEKEYEIFNKLFNDLVFHINNNKYDFVLNFFPLNIFCEDKKFRPKNIDFSKHQEHILITSYNNYFFYDKLLNINMNNVNEINKIIKLIDNNYGKLEKNVF